MVLGKTSRDLDLLMVIGLPLKKERAENLAMPFRILAVVRLVTCKYPVYYAVGRNNLNYALFLDNVYRQEWNFTKSPWQVRTSGDQLRFYIMTVAHLLDLRKEFLELVGRPPVPSRKTFGLWVSEYGYDNWKQIDTILSGLRSNNFPIDGFVLDLNWFGGIIPDDTQTSVDESTGSAMGRLNWNENRDFKAIKQCRDGAGNNTARLRKESRLKPLKYRCL